MTPGMFCLSVQPEPKLFKEEFERERVEAYAHIGILSLGVMRVTANTIRAIACPRRELGDAGIVVDPDKPWRCRRKGTP